MSCIISASIFSARQSTLLYTDELGCGTVQSPRPRSMGTALITPWSRTSTYRLRETPLLVPSGHRPSAIGQSPTLSYELRLRGPQINSGQRNFWEEGRGCLNTPGANGTAKPSHYFDLNVTLDYNYNKGEWWSQRRWLDKWWCGCVQKNLTTMCAIICLCLFVCFHRYRIFINKYIYPQHFWNICGIRSNFCRLESFLLGNIYLCPLWNQFKCIHYC